MNKKVTLVRFQTAIEFPGVGMPGQIGHILPSSSKTLDNLEMTVIDDVLEVSFSFKKLDHTLLVPLTNVIYMRAAKEDKKTK